MISKQLTIPLLLVAAVAFVTTPLTQEAFASCWWGCDDDDIKELWFQIG